MSAKPGEPSWDSPWGAGRPGWHIECSAMSAALLGHSFDIHGGGMDLIFPHHENEIAQSFAACKHSNVSYWMHNGFVTVDEEKMSKSLGNFFTIREVVDQYHPMAVRWFLLGTHYRSPVNYSKRQLDSATDRVYYLYQTLEDCSHSLVKEAYSKELAARNVLDCVKDLRTTFTSSMGDDLHTPVVVAALSEPLKFMNDLLHTRKGQKDVLKYNSLCLLQEEITNILEVLGLSVSSYSQVLLDIKRKTLKRAGLSEEDLLLQIQHRAAARAAKDYVLSDQIRAHLASVGVALMDGGDGTMWRPSLVTDDGHIT
ncbi:hypothetical protein O6H91_09G062600 [Diphasiastrum complanatum]|uniref:Uncharacterized protein n=1 Tax=Diphasiastrum complanatum TaxID=34168 RepID=A0ACC2CPV1_DIPCM|nr:hypothetical protein O6H91_09G062600 [Diphasiastrum complanatum]